jgi:hypothetical protein
VLIQGRTRLGKPKVIMRIAESKPYFSHKRFRTAILENMPQKGGQPRTGFYIFSYGGFEGKLL